MVGHGGSSASSYLADPTSPIPSHCASIVMTSTLRVNRPTEMMQKFVVEKQHYERIVCFSGLAYSYGQITGEDETTEDVDPSKNFV